jgi:hypothetical protein
MIILIPAHHTAEATCKKVWAKTSLAALHRVKLNKNPPQTGFCDIKLFFGADDPAKWILPGKSYYARLFFNKFGIRQD